MSIKNSNYGTLDSQGGSIHIGDVINGIPFLDKEFRDQLKDLEGLMESFQSNTSLKLLEKLEKRVLDSVISNKNEILSKLIFLKASCMDDLSEYSKTEISKLYINAYKLNKNDSELRKQACIEYLNLEEDKKANKLAKEILKNEDYDIRAWFVKIFCATDIKEALLNTPKIVKNYYFFQQSVTYQILRLEVLDNFEKFNEYNLSIDVDLSKYNNLKYRNRKSWMIAIDLLINKFFNEYPLRSIAGERLLFLKNETVEKSLILLDKYLNQLRNTELEKTTLHQKFYLNYLKYFRTEENEYLIEAENYYNTLPVNWFYTFTLCQMLNHKKDYYKSLTVLDEYIKKGARLTPEYYLLKVAIIKLSNPNDKIKDLFYEFLEFIPQIDEPTGFNLLNSFLNFLRDELEESEFDKVTEEILEKEFSSVPLKSLIKISIQIRYKRGIDKDALYQELLKLKNNTDFDINYKNLICENLTNIGNYVDAINYIETYLDKSKISHTLEIYIKFLEIHLYENTEAGTGLFKKLLKALKFWRLNSQKQIRQFLRLEHNLNTEKSNWVELIEIDKLLYENFPEDEEHILLYLNTLTKFNRVSDILKLSRNIPNDYTSDKIGTQISLLLLKEKKTKKKGQTIIFNLASKKDNSEARKSYFVNSNLFEQDFLKKYDQVEFNTWVQYSIDDKTQTPIKILNYDGLNGKLLGKKLGEKFSETNEINGRLYSIKIDQIFNDALNLHYDIQNEIKNPLNNLGFVSLNAPDNIEEFENLLKSEFGLQGAEEKNS